MWPGGRLPGGAGTEIDAGEGAAGADGRADEDVRLAARMARPVQRAAPGAAHGHRLVLAAGTRPHQQPDQPRRMHRLLLNNKKKQKQKTP